MSYKNKNESASNAIEKWSDNCGNINCNAETELIFIKVLNKATGKCETKSFSQCGYVNNGITVLNDQWIFKMWITRCGACYLQDVEDSGKKALNIAKQNYSKQNSSN